MAKPRFGEGHLRPSLDYCITMVTSTVSSIDDVCARDLVVQGLLLVVPEHPEVTDVDDLSGDERRKKRPADGLAPTGWLARFVVDHANANDPASKGLAAVRKLPNVEQEHDAVSEEDQPDPSEELANGFGIDLARAATAIVSRSRYGEENCNTWSPPWRTAADTRNRLDPKGRPAADSGGWAEAGR